MVWKHFVLSNMAHLCVSERQGPFKGHNRKKDILLNENWVSSLWLVHWILSDKLLAYVKVFRWVPQRSTELGSLSVWLQSYSKHLVVHYSLIIWTLSLTFLKRSLNFVYFMNICYVTGSWATRVRNTLKRHPENKFRFWKRELQIYEPVQVKMFMFII